MPSPEDIALLYLSPRSQELDELDRYVTCTQYEGRVDWFSSAEVPVVERKPCINYPITKNAIGSHVAFVLGDGRWPKLTSATTEDDQALDPDWGLSEDESSLFDRFVNVVLVRYASLQDVTRTMLADAMGSRSVAVVLSVRAGRLCAETVRASWCTPTLGDMGEVLKLEIQYPYIETFYNDQKRRWEERCMLYRRVLDEVNDTVFTPQPADPEGRPVAWGGKEDRAKSRAHGLGFCPAHWYPFMKPCSTVGTVDGVALHEQQLESIDALNIALSQKHRAATVAGDPQIVETGVVEDHNPAPMGASNRAVIAVRKVPTASGGTTTTSGFASQRTADRSVGRMKGAGVVWSYPNKDTKVEYLAIGSDVIKGIDDHARDLRNKIAEAFCSVFIDPNELRTQAALSGKALALVFAKQLSFDSLIRDDVMNKGLLPLISLLLRVICVVGSKNPAALYVPGVKKILPILKSFERAIVDGSEATGEAAGETRGATMWMPPRLEPIWGPWFPATEQDQLFVVQLVAAAIDAGVCTIEMGVEKLMASGIFPEGSPAEIAEAIAKERAAKAAEMQATMHALGGDDAHDAKTKKPASLDQAAE